MKHKFKPGDVVQFNENHKWIATLEIIKEVSEIKIMIGVPIPEKGIIYIYVDPKNNDIEYIGNSKFKFNK